MLWELPLARLQQYELCLWVGRGVECRWTGEGEDARRQFNEIVRRWEGGALGPATGS